jgi:hypothetical protein
MNGPRYFISVNGGDVCYCEARDFSMDGFFDALVFTGPGREPERWKMSRDDVDVFLNRRQFERCVATFPHGVADVGRMVAHMALPADVGMRDAKGLADMTDEGEREENAYASLSPGMSMDTCFS